MDAYENTAGINHGYPTEDPSKLNVGPNLPLNDVAITTVIRPWTH
jgi:hypothetical protein